MFLPWPGSEPSPHPPHPCLPSLARPPSTYHFLPCTHGSHESLLRLDSRFYRCIDNVLGGVPQVLMRSYAVHLGVSATAARSVHLSLLFWCHPLLEHHQSFTSPLPCLTSARKRMHVRMAAVPVTRMRQRNAARLIPIATTDVAWHVARADDSGRRSWSGKRGRLRRGRCGAAKRSWSARYAIRHSVIARAQHLARVTTPTPVPRPASHVGAKAHACAYEDSDMRCVRMPCAALDLSACISLRGIRACADVAQPLSCPLP
jgi:hypothetical protein